MLVLRKEQDYYSCYLQNPFTRIGTITTIHTTRIASNYTYGILSQLNLRDISAFISSSFLCRPLNSFNTTMVGKQGSLCLCIDIAGISVLRICRIYFIYFILSYIL